MPIIYHVTIEAAKKENTFCIKWTDKKNTVYSFEQSESDITPEEVKWMWKDRRNQLRIGEKLFRFLDGNDHYLQRALKDADNHDESLQVHLYPCREISNWPFELLVQNSTFLLPHCLHLVRSVPVQEAAKELTSQDRRLKLLFMACSPLDVQSETDFEQEEEAIFKVTERLAIDMEVEDTGSLEGLREKLQHRQYDILHLSGHAGIDQKGQPFFVMENETGNRENISAGELWQKALKVKPPRLLFISGSSTGDAPGETEGAFSHMLVEKYQIPAVLGWGRWISDGEANEAAKVIYKELSRGKSVLDAVQRARYQLFRGFPSTLKPAWPQLRLFSSGGSLNAIAAAEQKQQPQMRRMTHIYLKNSQVKVLEEGFVGRRRQLQQSLRVLKQKSQKVGLVILGTGGLGKSCLAGKISERFKEHTLVIVHGRLNSITLKRALKDAFILYRDDYGKNVLSWEMEMKDILGVLCRSCFKDKKYLILLDDFEQNLEGWDKGEPGGLFPEAVELLGVLLDLLPGTGKSTQLMITCRYGFSMHRDSPRATNVTEDSARRAIKSFSGDPGERFFKKVPLNGAVPRPAEGKTKIDVSLEDCDLVKERLESIWLTGFREVEQKKKVRGLPHISKQEEHTTVDELLIAGCGNPRLMEWIDILVGEMEKTGVRELLQAVCGKKREFIQAHVIKELLLRGGEELSLFLCWLAIYRRPVLKEGVKAVGEKARLKSWEDLLYRGMDLSLIEHDRARLSYQATPLLRDEFLKELGDLHACHEAAFTYYKKICDNKPEKQFDPIRVEEWIYHALGCGNEDAASRQGGKLVVYLRKRLIYLHALRVGGWIKDQKKKKFSTEHDAYLLNSLAYAMFSIGGTRKAIDYFEQALTIWKKIFGEKHRDVANVLNNLGDAWKTLGEPKKAIKYCKEAMSIWKVVSGDTHYDVAIALNNLGSAWQQLGDHRRAIDYYQEALTIDETAFGPGHPELAIDLNNLGTAWRAMGDSRKAINYFEQALTISRDVYREKHPQVAAGLNNLGEMWRDLGEPEKAINYHQEALTILKDIYGEKHRWVATGLNNLGLTYLDMNNIELAKDYLKKAYDTFYQVLGPEHQNTKTVGESLKVVLHMAGEMP